MSIKITDRDALIIVDMQNDFCSGGALPTARADEIVPVINRLTSLFHRVVMTQDWHPEEHLSFASSHPDAQPYATVTVSYGEQTLWPDHCVQGSHGAAFHKDIDVTKAELVLRKGFRREIDSYSAFQENDRTTKTGLAEYLSEQGIKRIFLTGLAYDYCVRYSALDACRAGFEVYVIEDACRAIDLQNSIEETRREFAERCIRQIRTEDLV